MERGVELRIGAEEVADNLPMRDLGGGEIGKLTADRAIRLPLRLILIPNDDDVDLERGCIDHEDIAAEDGSAVDIIKPREDAQAVGLDSVIAEINIALFVLLACPAVDDGAAVSPGSQRFVTVGLG